jgi:hypothetical protein
MWLQVGHCHPLALSTLPPAGPPPATAAPPLKRSVISSKEEPPSFDRQIRFCRVTTNTFCRAAGRGVGIDPSLSKQGASARLGEQQVSAAAQRPAMGLAPAAGVLAQLPPGLLQACPDGWRRRHCAQVAAQTPRPGPSPAARRPGCRPAVREPCGVRGVPAQRAAAWGLQRARRRARTWSSAPTHSTPVTFDSNVLCARCGGSM